MVRKRVRFLANIKQGALSQELGIPEEQNIPVTLLRRVKNAKAGTTVKNPTTKGKRSIRVTEEIKKQANFALNAKTKWKRKK